MSLPAALYLVATPIGNLKDITLRALETLGAVNHIFCEDKRVCGKLLKAHAIVPPPLHVYNDHSDEKTRAHVINVLSDGNAVALASDAGMPLISDPGYKLVRDVIDAGYKVIPIPGANAALSALQISGMPSDRFYFGGFVPVKEMARQKFLSEIAIHTVPVIVYETAPRLVKTLQAMIQIHGNAREIAVARELTKMHEECVRGPVADVLVHFEAHPPKGEIVIVIEAGLQSDIVLDNNDLNIQIRMLLDDHSVKDLVSLLVDKTHLSKKELYDHVIALKQSV